MPGGEGLARIDGVVTLVPGALPGDRVRLFAWRKRRRASCAGAPRRSSSRARRAVPDADVCALARSGACGGCDWPAARARTSPGAEDGARPRRAPPARRAEAGGSPRAALAGLASELPPAQPPAPRPRGPPRFLRAALERRRGPRGLPDRLEALPRAAARASRAPALDGADGRGALTLESRDGETLLGELRLGEGEGGRPGISSKVKRGRAVRRVSGRRCGRTRRRFGRPASLAIVAGRRLVRRLRLFFLSRKSLSPRCLSRGDSDGAARRKRRFS